MWIAVAFVMKFFLRQYIFQKNNSWFCPCIQRMLKYPAQLHARISFYVFAHPPSAAASDHLVYLIAPCDMTCR
jgi:hypothetical protein